MGCVAKINRLAPQAGEQYAYDAAGNLTRDKDGDAFAYDGENRQTTYNGGASVNGGATYSYDGDGRRVKKVAGVVSTVFVYDAMGQLVAEYSSEAPTENGTQYLTADSLGTPRVITGADGVVKARHDYLPFGEEIGADVGGRTTGQGYVGDNIRQKFTGIYERDAETGLDFAQARYYSNKQGRFTSVDPLYYQSSMATDPQRFNLYAYVRNNPLRYVDPSGEKVHMRGTAIQDLQEMVGGQDVFDFFFYVKDGQALLRFGVDVSSANAGVQFLAGLVNASENYLFYSGDNAQQAASYFKTDRTFTSTRLQQNFNRGLLVGTPGRLEPTPANLPNGEEVWAAIAVNTATGLMQSSSITENVTGASSNRVPFETDVLSALISGSGQRVKPVSLFIHEAAERQKFKEIGVYQQFIFGRGRRGEFDNYPIAHKYAKSREAQIRRELGITGGFAGGSVRSLQTTPQRR